MLSQPSDPTKLRILAGSLWAGRSNEPLPPAGLPDRPAYLDEIAKAKWAELCQVLGETGLLTRADRDMMAMYCTAFSQWREASEMVKKSGLVIKGAGGVCANPCVAIAANARREMRDLSALLGLDPASRLRIWVGTEPKFAAVAKNVCG